MLSLKESGYVRQKENIHHEAVCGSVQALLAELPMEPMQCRAARGLLHWTQNELARRAGVSDVTIRGFENDQTTPTRATLAVLRQAFEKGGVEFTNDDQPGVRMKRKRRKSK
jgi:DNA-binding transcriptional regulator YiaG